MTMPTWRKQYVWDCLRTTHAYRIVRTVTVCDFRLRLCNITPVFRISPIGQRALEVPCVSSLVAGALPLIRLCLSSGFNILLCLCYLHCFFIYLYFSQCLISSLLSLLIPVPSVSTPRVCFLEPVPRVVFNKEVLHVLGLFPRERCTSMLLFLNPYRHYAHRFALDRLTRLYQCTQLPNQFGVLRLVNQVSGETQPWDCADAIIHFNISQ